MMGRVPGRCVWRSVLLVALSVSVSCAQAPEWQPNQPEASVGMIAQPPGNPFGPFYIEVTSTLAGAPWEVALVNAPAVPLSLGGIPLSDGQVVNLNFMFGPPDLLWNGFQGPGIPSYLAIVVPNLAPMNGHLSAQMAVIDPSTRSGIRLSQAIYMFGMPTCVHPWCPG